jgi:glucose-1-phosphatase
MVKENIKAIIFDFGGVIINIDYDATIRAFEKMGLDNFAAQFSQAKQTDLFDNFEIGKISPQHFINGLLNILPSGISPNEIVYAWNAMLLDIPLERIELLLSLKDKYKIYLLSNTNSLHIDAAIRKWNTITKSSIYEVFDHVYFSHEMGMRKPNVEIFDAVCKEQGINPETTLFIDDSIQHIHGAKEAGLNTLHLTNGLEIQDVFS